MSTRWAVVCLLFVLLRAASADADSDLRSRASAATRQGGIRLPAAVPGLALADTSLICFQDSLSLVLNVGCFSPPGDGLCTSASTHFFIQYLTPGFSEPHQVLALGFISNDGNTIFPSAGVVLIPTAENRFPTAGELASLQAHTLQAAQDLGIVVADLESANLIVNPGMDLIVALQFPQGGRLTAVGVGPGVVVDEVSPDENCDFFTADAGASWFRPLETDPLDWGFEVVTRPATSVEGTTWSDLKRLYGGPQVFPYKAP